MLQNAVCRVRLRPTFTVTLFVLSRRRFPPKKRSGFSWRDPRQDFGGGVLRPQPLRTRRGSGRDSPRAAGKAPIGWLPEHGTPSSLIHVAVRHRWRGRLLLLSDARDQHL